MSPHDHPLTEQPPTLLTKGRAAGRNVMCVGGGQGMAMIVQRLR
ncbi:MAG: hypothetical protein ACE367_09450 [Acidimicrobiales bacterium]